MSCSKESRLRRQTRRRSSKKREREIRTSPLIGKHHTCRLSEWLDEYVHHTRSGRKNFVQGILSGCCKCKFCIVSRIHQLLAVFTSCTWTSLLQDLAKGIALVILIHQAKKGKGVARETTKTWKIKSNPSACIVGRDEVQCIGSKS